MAAVSFRNVYKSFGAVKVIEGVSIDVADGEFVVIVGPSGCGKSTLLRMLAGLERLTSGEVAIGGKVVNELEPKDRDIAMVFQNYALYPHMSVYANMAYGLKIRGLAKAEIDKRVQRAAEILELSALLKRNPRDLSGGQRQRVAMGRAIVREPAVFLFDEPLSNLDAKLRVQMRGELQELHKRLGTTTLYVTHDQVEAMTLAQRMLVLNAGCTEQIGAPLEVYARPATTFVAGFIGSPPMNLIGGRIAPNGATLAAEGEVQVRLPRPLPMFAGRGLLLGVRPEDLLPCEAAAASFAPHVDFIELLGSDTLVYGHIGPNKTGTRVAARLHAHLPQRQAALPLRFEAEAVHLFDADTGKRIEP
ncbi:MAG TPA: sn-glycerol-3-phosphate import ATP-binding protein UgpC [Burkholderiales bacterium]|nr:sn-glycerol-3-phosphate import ATP-binding protein UgpC [Burkholderiales bacterium]